MKKVDRFSEHTESGRDGFVYFKPEYFAKYGFFSEEEIKELIDSNAKILSVGSGPAYFENRLVQLGVPRENIILSDIDDSVAPKEFTVYQFDMHEDWPQINEGPFNLIIAPESFGVSLYPYSGYYPTISYELPRFVRNAIKALKPGGELRMIDPIVRKSFIQELVDEMKIKLSDLNITIEVNEEILSVRRNKI